MKGKFCLLIMIATLNPLGVDAQGIDDVIDSLANADGYRSRVTYEVVIPSFSNPIIYDIDIASAKSDCDTLSSCSYLIDWRVPTVSGESNGFSAYHNGHHYRYRDNRLQEYHVEWDSIPFGLGKPHPAASIERGVQNNAQFTEILPQFMARQLAKIKTDSTYSYSIAPDSLVGSRHLTVLKALQRYKGYDSKELTYFFDPATLMPLRLEIENNPGSIGEQQITVTYTPFDNAETVNFTESGLVERYPEAFEKYRLSYFKVENLPGTQLPGFSAPTPTGERYSRATGDKFASPTLVVFLDPKVGTANKTIELVRKGVDSLPMSAEVIWAFTSNNINDIDNVIIRPRPGEHIVMSAKSLARDCGVSTFPITLICDTYGKINDVIIGFNKNIDSDVIQKTAIIGKL